MEEGAGAIVLIIIGLILYFAWEVVVILLLLGLVFCIAKKIYKIKWSHSVLLMYIGSVGKRWGNFFICYLFLSFALWKILIYII